MNNEKKAQAMIVYAGKLIAREMLQGRLTINLEKEIAIVYPLRLLMQIPPGNCFWNAAASRSIKLSPDVCLMLDLKEAMKGLFPSVWKGNGLFCLGILIEEGRFTHQEAIIPAEKLQRYIVLSSH